MKFKTSVFTVINKFESKCIRMKTMINACLSWSKIDWHSMIHSNLSVTVKTDILNFMIAEVMFQQDVNQQLQSVIYFSFKMLFAECNYKIYDKELLTIIRVFEKWWFKLKSTLIFVKVIFNHKNLKYFMLIKLFSRR